MKENSVTTDDHTKISVQFDNGGVFRISAGKPSLWNLDQISVPPSLQTGSASWSTNGLTA